MLVNKNLYNSYTYLFFWWPPAQEVSVGVGSPWVGSIGACFEPHLSLYITSLDSNLRALLDTFLQVAHCTAPEPPWRCTSPALTATCASCSTPSCRWLIMPPPSRPSAIGHQPGEQPARFAGHLPSGSTLYRPRATPALYITSLDSNLRTLLDTLL